MGSRIVKVFYDQSCYPFKDSERTVRYPITGSSFAGSSNVNELHFYVRDIGGVNNLSWVAIVKLPNGKILYQLLTDIHLDSEINEYYVTFNLSQFYTQLKGDIYISLNGCMGEVTITTDQETDISTIQGEIDSKTVVATGAVKFSINYAPQRPIGLSFDLDQYQTIINALANKTNIISTFQIVADISTETLTNYEDGQVFYDIATKRFYKKSSGSYVDYNFIVSNQAGVSIIVNPTTNINGRVFVHFTSVSATIGGASVYQIKYDGENTTEEQAREYMSYMTGSSYLPKYNYDRPANTYFLMPNGQILKPQYDSTNGLVLFIMSQLALKNYVDENFVPYTGATKNVNLGNKNLIAEHLYKGSESTNNELTTKGQMDSAITSAIESVKRNAFILVDLVQYPTLQSFLASTGEEGYIYLYPINTSDLSQGYEQYIWENNGWLFIGLTVIDLSDYYKKPQVDSLLLGKLDKRNTTGLRAYTHNGSTQNDVIVTNANHSNSIPLRDNDGNIQVGTPSNSADATPKTYVDTLGLNLDNAKVDKVNAANQVYGTDSIGAQTSYTLETGVNGVVARRDGSGQLIVPQTPTDNSHATSKKYVDTSIANAVSNVYRPMGSKTVAQINAMNPNDIRVGDVYNVLDSGTITLGNLQVFTGDNIVWTGSAWDKLGAEIDWTAYDEKFIAAGFFEVQPYNENTGEITFVYSTELYIMSYDDNTGVMTISAN